MKFSYLFICLLLLFSFSLYAGDLEISIDAEKDAYYNTLTGPGDGWLWLPSLAFNDNGDGPDDDSDLSANYFSAWDETYLYIYEEVSDDVVNQNNATWYENDGLDIKFDPDLFVDDTESVFTLTMTCMDSADVDASLYDGIRNLAEGWLTTELPSPEDYARKLTDTGYVLELRVKWEWIAIGSKGPIEPTVGDIFGMAVMNHDNDTGARDCSIEWATSLTDQVWNNCNYLGSIELLEDNKINYLLENFRDGSIFNENPDMYIPIPGSSAIPQTSAVVDNFILSQNYPNPFNPTTRISYSLQKTSDVKISVYDLQGKEVAMLVEGRKSAGNHVVQFDGSNLSSGIYFYRLQSEGRIFSKKMTLIK